MKCVRVRVRVRVGVGVGVLTAEELSRKGPQRLIQEPLRNSASFAPQRLMDLFIKKCKR